MTTESKIQAVRFTTMAAVVTKFTLDTRAAKKGADAPLKIYISHKRKVALLSLNIYVQPSQWDAKAEKVVNHTNQLALNTHLGKQKLLVDRELLRLMDDDAVSKMTATDIRNKMQSILFPVAEAPKVDENTFEKWFQRFADHKDGRTRGLYLVTLRRLQAFYGPKLSSLHFEDINKAWLEDFDDFLAVTSPSANARAIHLRNVRAVFNDAIDNEITTNYPFRRFKIKGEPTRKRSFAVEVLRRIFSHKCEDEWQEKYRDWFTLTFMLIGINVVDLFGVKVASDGRVDYIRAKTHKPYSIKIEPECQALLDRYAGGHHLLGYLDGYKDYRSFYMNLCTGLRQIKEQLGLSELTTYWARHSWATVAASLDIPKDTIAHALGHGGNSVTDIYIDFDMKKVDEANRRVLDWVLYGKDWRNPEKPKRGRPKKSA